ncbi:hypothetical protein Ancab_030005 [Ancistrocladus abbreviatus]
MELPKLFHEAVIWTRVRLILVHEAAVGFQVEVECMVQLSKQNAYAPSLAHRRLEVVCLGMLKPRKFMQKRKKVEVVKDSDDEADQKNWRRRMQEIDESGFAVPVLRSRRDKNQALPKGLVLGTLVRLKQLKKWNLVSEVTPNINVHSFLHMHDSMGPEIFRFVSYIMNPVSSIELMALLESIPCYVLTLSSVLIIVAFKQSALKGWYQTQMQQSERQGGKGKS